MRKLLDAFLELPTWQGILLIVLAVGFVMIVAAIVERIAWQRGWNACRERWESKEQARHFREASERI
jgi:hypothetical protein